MDVAAAAAALRLHATGSWVTVALCARLDDLCEEVQIAMGKPRRPERRVPPRPQRACAAAQNPRRAEAAERARASLEARRPNATRWFI